MLNLNKPPNELQSRLTLQRTRSCFFSTFFVSFNFFSYERPEKTWGTVKFLMGIIKLKSRFTFDVKRNGNESPEK